MTIHNDCNRTAAGGGDLLDRVRRAHDRETSDGEEVDGAGQGAVPLSDRLRQAERRVLAETDGELEGRLVGTACEVIDGEYDSPEAVREAIVDTVVDANYDNLVAGDGREPIVAAVKESLAGDAMFRAEVENMLIRAARRLGRAQRGQRAGEPETDSADGPR